jgi:hypothetical protein
MSSSSDMKQMYQSAKPQYPDCVGKQFAGDAATPEYLDVTYDKNGNEKAEDRPYHMDGLSGDSGREGYKQFASDFSSYGQAVDASNPTVEKVSVDTSRADRGKES